MPVVEVEEPSPWKGGPLWIKVITRRIETRNIESVRIIDHWSKEDRVWLGRHCYWAFRNGRAVTTFPVEWRRPDGGETI